MLMFDNDAQARLHRRTAKQRTEILAKLHSTFEGRFNDDISDEEAACQKLYTQISECGREPCIYIDRERGRVIRSLGRCGQRHCPTCAEIRSKDTAQRVEKHIAHMDAPALLTLTLKPSSDNLADQLDHLTASVRRLRQTAAWKDHISGGVMCIEVTRNPKTGFWHPHAHILADMTYWPQRAVSHAWDRASQGSTIVDIRRTQSKAAAARYVAKYIAKAADPSAIPAAAMTDWVDGWKKRRRIQPFGSCHGIKTAQPRLKTTEPLTVSAQLNAVSAEAKAGDQSASDLLRRLANLTPWPDDDQPTPEISSEHADLIAVIDAWADAHARKMSPERYATDPPPPDPQLALF